MSSGLVTGIGYERPPGRIGDTDLWTFGEGTGVDIIEGTCAIFSSSRNWMKEFSKVNRNGQSVEPKVGCESWLGLTRNPPVIEQRFALVTCAAAVWCIGDACLRVWLISSFSEAPTQFEAPGWKINPMDGMMWFGDIWPLVSSLCDAFGLYFVYLRHYSTCRL